MSRSGPASNPVSYHEHAMPYDVARGGERIHLGACKEQAIRRYHEPGLGFEVRISEAAHRRRRSFGGSNPHNPTNCNLKRRYPQIPEERAWFKTG